MKTPLRTLMWVVVAALTGAGLYGYRLYRDVRADLYCKGTLKAFNYVVTTADGGVLSEAVYIEKAAQLAPTWNWCPTTHSPYVYRPFEGSISVEWYHQVVGPPRPSRMIAWCPRPCHRGHRNVLLEDGRVIEMEEVEFAEASKNGFEVSR